MRQAKIFEILGAVFGALWIIGTLLGIGWILTAIFSNASWVWGIAIILGAQFAKAVNREYNRASQKAINDGIAAGTVHVDGAGYARPLKKIDRLSSRAAIQEAFTWANNLVDRYTAVLERQTGSPYMSEDALPAKKDELKDALLIVATVRKTDGKISDTDLRMYKEAYTWLSFVTADDRAHAVNRAISAVKTVGGVSNLSADQLHAAVRDIASVHQGQQGDDIRRDAEVLPGEFDARLAALMAIYRHGAA